VNLNDLIEIVIVILFGSAVTAVLTGFAKVTGQLLKARGTYKLKATDYILLVLGCISIACIAYGFIEPFEIETTFNEIATDKVQQSENPIRIVHLSDLHCDGVYRLEKQLPERVRNLHPDLIVFTGDAANNNKGRIEYHELAQALSAIAPTFAVFGNHDKRGLINEVYKGTGIKVLDATCETLTIKGTKVWIGGAAVDDKKGLDKSSFEHPSDALSIFLYHYPCGIEAASANKVDLLCSGHTHGGQIRLPLYGALITNSSLGKKYEWGLYRVDKTWLYVSRGIGMIGLPVRFLCAPEIAVISVKKIAR
jgi:uncharacterized protein